MADYPPTPPFGFAPSRAAPSQHEVTYQGIYENGNSGQPDITSLFEQHKVQTREAFTQNAKLPGFSAASTPSGNPPLPKYEDHKNHPYGYQNKKHGHERSLNHTRSRNNYKSPSGPSRRAPKPPNEGESIFARSHASTTQNIEEGELSEGEFEETPPTDNRNAAPLARRNDYHDRKRDSLQPPTHRGTFNNSNRGVELVSDTPLTDMYGRSLDLIRHRSESYSPYEPPNEIEYEPRLAQEIFVPRHQQSYHDEYEPPEEIPQMQRVPQSEYQSDSSQFESLEFPSQSYMAHKGLAAKVENQPYPDTSRMNTITKSLHDARKEAQNAILNLLPLKVRYNDYIEEGIDESIVRQQFESLGFPLTGNDALLNKPYGENMMNNPPEQTQNARRESSGAESAPQALQGSRVHDAVIYEKFTSSDHSPAQINNGNNQKPDNLNPVESRKDRIARLLAEKKKTLPSPAMQSNSPVNSASPEASHPNKATTNSQSAAKADKERLLRQKMEALQKSREQRAQKAAAKTAITAASATVNIAEDNPQKPTIQPMSELHALSQPPLAISRSPVQAAGKPSIPGLFLASGPTIPQIQASNAILPNAVQVGGQRKRPVASDFDKPTSTTSPNRRPFGQSRNDKPLVIDVSDDDSDASNHSEMEVDPSQLSNSGVVLQNNSGMTRTKAIRDLPPLSDFPPRKPFTTPSSNMGTPSAAQPMRQSASKPVDLHRKELEIQEMKRRIAEAERRKRAKQNSSGSQTPKPPDLTGSSAMVNGVNLEDKFEISVHIENLIDDASRQVHHDQLKLAETQVEEEETAEELMKSEAERRRLRRAEIASNLPEVDAAVEKAQKQLADLRAEIARIESAVQKGLDDKRRLAEEMEKLSREADEQLQLQKDALNKLNLEETIGPKAIDQAEDDQSIMMTVPRPAQEHVDAITTDAQSILNLGSHQQQEETVSDSVRSASTSVSHPLSEDNSIKSREPPRGSPDRLTSEQSMSSKREGSLLDIAPDEALEVALQKSIAEIDGEPDPGSGSDIEMADLFVPDIEISAPISAEDFTESSQQEEDLIESSQEPMNVADGESDPYEPPEATPSPVNMTLVGVDSPPFSPAPPHAMSGNSHTDKQHNNISLSPNEMNVSRIVVHDNDVALPRANQDSHSLAGRKTFFTPYESPLKSFRAFRFHPTFQQEVQGGFKSITYSNNIKEDKELCRYELAGGVCNDASCEFQHFRDMGLADDAILVELGNSAGYSEEDKPRFVAGLRTILQDLRSKKTKDFQVIASEIAAYRARFLGNKSKILLLEDTST